MTLEEYLKTQKEKELEIIPKLETRKANEGDDTIWKDAIVVNKKDEEEDTYFAGKVGYWLPFLSLHTLILSAIRLRMPHQSLAQKRKRKSSSRSMPASSVLSVAAVAAVVVREGLSGLVAGAVVVGEGDPTVTRAQPLWTSMTRRPSHPLAKERRRPQLGS